MYVGQTWKDIGYRFKQHRLTRRCPKLASAMKSHGIENFTIESVYRVKTQEQADLMEDFFILAGDTIENGYNLKRGGHGGKVSDEVKAKISKGNTGHRHTKASKQLMSQNLRGMHAGSQHPCALFTENQVGDIKRTLRDNPDKYGILSELGRKYGVSPQVIYLIKVGKTWKHVQI